MEISVNDEIVNLCTDLGHINQLDGKYILNKSEYNTKSCIKDLIKYLMRDDGDFSARCQMGISNILQSDLIPMLDQHCEQDEELFNRVLRLLVDLTNPALIHFKEKIPTEKDKYQKYLQLESFLNSYKASFGSTKKAWIVIAKYMRKVLDVTEENDDWDFDHRIFMERILILIRNLLHVPIDDSNEKGTDEDKNTHDRVIEMMQTSGVNDLLLRMCKSTVHYEFNLHLLEIVSLMLREQNAEFLAKSVDDSGEMTRFEKEQDKKELLELRTRESAKQQVLSKSNYRRIQGGTYYVKNMKSISDRDLICHKTPNNLHQMSFDENKKLVKKPKNRAPMKENSALTGSKPMHKSTLQIRGYLNEFCVRFLIESYYQFMRNIRTDLRNSSKRQDNDETYYYWALQFFMEFARNSPKIKDYNLINWTVSISSFHDLETNMLDYLDKMKILRDECKQWSKRLHFALKAYREMIFSLMFLHNLKEERFQRNVQEVKHAIFYEIEYRELLMILLNNYNEAKMSKSYLKDLIETNHVFLKLLEHYCKSNEKIVVKKKVKRKKKKAKKSTQESNSEPPVVIWSEISAEISEALQGTIELPSLVDEGFGYLFDPLSEKSADEQKMEMMKQIHKLLIGKKGIHAVALYREARNFFINDEDQAFGAGDIQPEDELISLHEILLQDFPVDDKKIDEELEDEIDEDANEEDQHEYREVEFSFKDVISKYAHPNIIIALGLLLKNFDTNSDETNHCIVKMLHRIAWDCQMHAMLFQVSLFQTFQRILADPLANTKLMEMNKFVKFIITKFVECSKKNKKVFVELLFWKSSREAYEVEEGYDAGEKKKSKKSKSRSKRKKGRDSVSDGLIDVVDNDSDSNIKESEIVERNKEDSYSTSDEQEEQEAEKVEDASGKEESTVEPVKEIDENRDENDGDEGGDEDVEMEDQVPSDDSSERSESGNRRASRKHFAMFDSDEEDNKNEDGSRDLIEDQEIEDKNAATPNDNDENDNYQDEDEVFANKHKKRKRIYISESDSDD